jgi:hypothetical protein
LEWEKGKRSGGMPWERGHLREWRKLRGKKGRILNIHIFNYMTSLSTSIYVKRCNDG